MKISRARLQVLIREEIARKKAQKNRRLAPTLAERRVARRRAAMANKRSMPVIPANITKSMLQKIIREEMQGALLELRDDDETQHIGGGDSKTHAGKFDYDTGEDEVFEGAEFDDGVGTELSEEDDNWIQKADADIKRRGTKGRCTGDKFGSESCPEGSREYDLAKTFKKMAHDHD